MNPEKVQLRSRFRRPRKRYLFFGILAMAAIAGISTLPGNVKAALHTSGRLHTSLHVLAFTTMAYFAFRGVRSPTAHLLLVAAGLALGVGSEYAEHAIYGSPLEYRDMASDAVGVLLGSTLPILQRRAKIRRMLTA